MSNPIWTTLISCSACSHSIAPLADKCPSCGAPNAWRHPLIDRLYTERTNIATRTPFNFTADKHSVRGETALAPTFKSTATLVVGLVIGFFAMFLLHFWIGLLISVVVGALSALGSKRRVFVADLQAGSWTSNDEEFWRPVKALLQL